MKRRIFVFSILIVIFISSYSQISRNEAYELLKQTIFNGAIDSVEILASQTPLQPLYQIRTNDTFVPSPSYESWFFFVDENPGADWWHPCKYVFISTVSGNITVTNK